MSYMIWFITLGADTREKGIIEQLRPNDAVGNDLFECLTDITDYFFRQTHASPELTVGCFKACSVLLTQLLIRRKVKSQTGQTKSKSRQRKGKNSDTNPLPNAESEFLSFDIQVLSFPAKKEIKRLSRDYLLYFVLKRMRAEIGLSIRSIPQK